MRQVENEAFLKDLQEAADSKQQLADQLSDARAEAASWQHQLAEAKEVQDSLRERIRLERAEKQALEEELEVILSVDTDCFTMRCVHFRLSAVPCMVAADQK